MRPIKFIDRFFFSGMSYNLRKMEAFMEYIHFNPVKAGFVHKPEHWRYSSAVNYLGKKGLIPITLFTG